MKRLLTLIFLLSSMICVNAQVWYYVDSNTDITTGASSRAHNYHYTVVLVKDYNGNLWMHYESGDDSLSALRKMKDAFALSSNFYVNAFNNSEHGQKPGPGGFRDMRPDYNSPRSYTDNRLSSYSLRSYFSFVKLNYVERLQKCVVYEYNHGARMQFAIGNDYETIIMDPDKSSPTYFKSYSPSDFITHSSADDLF